MNPMMRFPDLASLTRSLAVALLGVACLLPARGQTAAPAVEPLARDMHEEVVRIKVTVSDMYGRQ